MKYDLKVDANASSFFMKPDLQEYVFDALGSIFQDDIFMDEALDAEEITEDEAKKAEKWNLDNLLTADILEKNVSILVEPCNITVDNGEYFGDDYVITFNIPININVKALVLATLFK